MVIISKYATSPISVWEAAIPRSSDEESIDRAFAARAQDFDAALDQQFVVLSRVPLLRVRCQRSDVRTECRAARAVRVARREGIRVPEFVRACGTPTTNADATYAMREHRGRTVGTRDADLLREDLDDQRMTLRKRLPLRVTAEVRHHDLEHSRRLFVAAEDHVRSILRDGSFDVYSFVCPDREHQ